MRRGREGGGLACVQMYDDDGAPNWLIRLVR